MMKIRYKICIGLAQESGWKSVLAEVLCEVLRQCKSKVSLTFIDISATKMAVKM